MNYNFSDIQTPNDYSETIKKVIDPRISYSKLAQKKLAERKLLFPNDLQNYYYQPKLKHAPEIEKKINDYMF